MNKQIGSTIVILVLSLNVAMASPPGGQTGDKVDGVILMGQAFAFILKEPPGWILDTSAGKSSGLHAVVYREGSSWKDGVAVMYVRVLYKNQDRKTLEDVIQSDIKDFKDANRNSTVSPMRALMTRDKKQAKMRRFHDAQNKNWEAVAYIDQPCTVAIMALTSRTESEYANSLPAFESFVASYFFFKELAGSQ